MPTDVWVVASWEEFIDIADSSAYKKAKCYYPNGQMRIETMSVVPTHSRDNAILFFTEIIAFAIISDNGSRRLLQSEVLPGLTIALLEEALQRSRTQDQAQVGNWLLTQFQQ